MTVEVKKIVNFSANTRVTRERIQNEWLKIHACRQSKAWFHPAVRLPKSQLRESRSQNAINRSERFVRFRTEMKEPEHQRDLNVNEKDSFSSTITSIARDKTLMMFQLNNAVEYDSDTLYFFGYRYSGLLAAAIIFQVCNFHLL